MTNEQTAVLLISIRQLIKNAEREVRGVLPNEKLKPNQHSTASKVCRVFDELDSQIWKQLTALGTVTHC